MMMMWWWLSFADGDRPPGSQFLGCAAVDAPDMPSAIRRAHVLGINPGGEVLAGCIGKVGVCPDPPDAIRNKLVRSRAAVEALDDEWCMLMDARKRGPQ